MMRVCTPRTLVTVIAVDHTVDDARHGRKPAFCKVAPDARFATWQRTAGILPIS